MTGSADTGGSESDESRRYEALAQRLQEAVRELFTRAGAGGQTVKNLLNGTWLGEPLHATLTDIPVGAWTAAVVFDVLDLLSGHDELATAADACVAVGIAGALAAAATGTTDWQDVDGEARRLGMVHGALNVSGTTLFAVSLIARRNNARGTGRMLAALAYGVMGLSAHLGGEMVYKHRVGVDRTAGQSFPTEFEPVLAELELAEAQPKRAEHEGVPIVLVRQGNRIFALAETCSHFGGPLSEGVLIDQSIVCPWHKSRFALEDGRVLDGPAVHPQPCLQTRVQNGQIEVRKAR